MPGPSGNQVLIGSARSGGFREAMLRPGPASLGGVMARGVTAVLTTRKATRRFCCVASLGEPSDRGPGREPGGRRSAVLRVGGCSRAGPNKGGFVGILGETLVDARRKAGAGPFGVSVRG